MLSFYIFRSLRKRQLNLLLLVVQDSCQDSPQNGGQMLNLQYDILSAAQCEIPLTIADGEVC